MRSQRWQLMGDIIRIRWIRWSREDYWLLRTHPKVKGRSLREPRSILTKNVSPTINPMILFYIEKYKERGFYQWFLVGGIDFIDLSWHEPFYVGEGICIKVVHTPPEEKSLIQVLGGRIKNSTALSHEN
jgi:hypothetical protein